MNEQRRKESGAEALLPSLVTAWDDARNLVEAWTSSYAYGRHSVNLTEVNRAALVSDVASALQKARVAGREKPRVVAALDPRKPAPRYHSFVNVILPGGGGLCCEWCGVAHNDTEDGAWGRLTEEQKARPIVSDVCPKAPLVETPADRPTSRGGDDCEDGVESELVRVGLDETCPECRRIDGIHALGCSRGATRAPNPEAGAVVPLGAYEALRREIDDLHLKLTESEARVRKLVGLVTDFANGARAAIRFVDSDGTR